jgi:uncharacterized protein (TIGR03437 family)
MDTLVKTIVSLARLGNRCFVSPILVLAFTIFPWPAVAQPGPLFYRSDYPVNYSQLGEEGPVVVADFNNDGKLDIAIGAGLGIAVALGNGDGTFAPFMTLVPAGGGVGGAWVLSSAAADFDGDGNIDLVLVPSEGSGGGVIILPGNGDGTFGLGNRITATGFTALLPFLQVVAAADLNHDGRPDLVLLTYNGIAPSTASVIVFLNGGDGTFSSSTAFNLPNETAAGDYALGVAIADFNRDGTADLAVIGEVLGGSCNLYVALGKGDGSFSPPVMAYSFPLVPNFITSADFNHDGVPDLAIDTGTTFIFLGNGDGTFRAAPNVNLGHVNPGTIVTADWTGSGNPGLGIFNPTTPGVGIMAGNGDGTFNSAGTAALDLSNVGPSAYSTGDFNSDGLPDLVAASAGTTISVFLNAGASPPLSFIPQSAADDITTVAPGSLASIYGQFLFSATSASGSPLPLQLAGATVNVRDSGGVTRPAPLSYVSTTQINLEIPPSTAPGVAGVTVQSNESPLAGAALVRNVVPAIFTERYFYPAAYAVTYGPDGQAQPPVLVSACQTSPPLICNAVPIPRPAGSRVFLELYATGIRNHVSPVVVSLSSGPEGPGTPGPLNVAPAYAGPQGQFDGLDQVNVEITTLPTLAPAPQAAPGTPYTLVLNVDGLISNAVEFTVE